MRLAARWSMCHRGHIGVLALLLLACGGDDEGTEYVGWGPCSFEAAGHPDATAVELRSLSWSELEWGAECTGEISLFQSRAEWGEHEGVEEGDDPAVDWDVESLLFVRGLSGQDFVAGVEGEALVLATYGVCQGMAPSCTEATYAMRKVASTVTAGCPPPTEPCMAP